MFINHCKTKFIHSIIHGLSALCNFCRTFWWPRFCDFMSLVYVCYWPFHDLILPWNPHNARCMLWDCGLYTNMLWTVNKFVAYIGIVWIVGRKENMVTMLFTTGSFLLVMSNDFLRKAHGHYLKILSWNVSYIVIIQILWIKDFILCLIESH